MKGLSLVSRKTRLALAGVLLMVPALCAAQSAQASDRHLEGIVVDQQALPIPGAQISVAQTSQLKLPVCLYGWCSLVAT